MTGSRPGALVVEALVRGRSGPRVDARFEAPPGITVLFGPSGAGKSTCLHVVAGLLRPSRGRVVLGARVLTDTERGIFVPPHRRRIALLFQSLALFPHMSALDNVAYGIDRDLPAAERRARAHEWLERMMVKHLDHRMPVTFSGGEAQRVALARALASAPSALLLDEPLCSLDVALRKELRAQVQSVVAAQAIPTLWVTHDPEDLEALGAPVVRV